MIHCLIKWKLIVSDLVQLQSDLMRLEITVSTPVII